MIEVAYWRVEGVVNRFEAKVNALCAAGWLIHRLEVLRGNWANWRTYYVAFLRRSV